MNWYWFCCSDKRPTFVLQVIATGSEQDVKRMFQHEIINFMIKLCFDM